MITNVTKERRFNNVICLLFFGCKFSLFLIRERRNRFDSNSKLQITPENPSASLRYSPFAKFQMFSQRVRLHFDTLICIFRGRNVRKKGLRNKEEATESQIAKHLYERRRSFPIVRTYVLIVKPSIKS